MRTFRLFDSHFKKSHVSLFSELKLLLSSSGETTRPELRSRLFANICHSSDAEMSFSYNCTEKHISSQISPGKEWCEQVNLLSPPLLNTSIRQIQILKSRVRATQLSNKEKEESR